MLIIMGKLFFGDTFGRLSFHYQLFYFQTIFGFLFCFKICFGGMSSICRQRILIDFLILKVRAFNCLF